MPKLKHRFRSFASFTRIAKLLIIAGVSCGAARAQKIDYNSGLKNQPLRVPLGGSIANTLTAAVAGSTVTIPAGTFTYSSTIAKTLTIACEPGAVISVTANVTLSAGTTTDSCYWKTTTGNTLTVLGPIKGSNYQFMFDSTAGGTVVIAQREQCVTWFGANAANQPTIDSTEAFQAALNSVAYASTAGGTGKLHIPSGIYYAGQLSWPASVSIDGDGPNSTAIYYNGTSGNTFVNYPSSNANTIFHLRGITLAGQSGHIPSNILVFQTPVDLASVIDDIALSVATNDCIQFNGWINLYITGHVRFDGCATNLIHLIPVTAQFGSVFSMDNFTATVIGYNTQHILYVDNSSGAASQLFSNIHISNTRLEVNTNMASPYAILGFAINGGAITFAAENVIVDNSIGQGGLIFMYTDTAFPFHLRNISPDATWFNSSWGASVVGLQTASYYMSSLDYVGSGPNPGGVPYALGPAVSTCTPQSAAGSGATCVVSSAYVNTQSGFAVNLTTGTSPTANSVLAVLPFATPSLWSGKIPVCTANPAVYLAMPAGYQHLFVIASASEWIIFSDSTGATGSTAYTLEISCH